ncbi:VWA domain-containing protein [Actinoallomurus sp. NBC_01490]|uniref:vWA domain-containing protein n=1 Tax=Actinoallomurus sp. NBC_01490 TaxID=2903557 RepID=UPI002E3288C8|nr:vWA domain-containing protein [Actinoallomurus sp. NBC_01490]
MTRRLRAAVCVVVAGAMLVAGVGTASATPGVTPSDVTLNLSPGESATIAKTVSTPAIPPKPDITFLIDTTGSMGGVISNVQANANTILSNVASAQPDAQFAVAEYRDVSADATPFRVAQNLTADQADVANGLNSLVASGGGDYPEDGINGLFQVASGAVDFRSNSSRIVLLIGDAPSHDPSNGHSLADATSALQAAGITVLALDLSGLDSTGQATAITNATGGQLFSGIDASQVSSTILAALHNLPVTVTHRLRDCDPNLSVSLTPDSRTVTSGDDAGFTEVVSAGAGAAPGSTLNCKVDFLLNGVLQPGFTETITEHVPKVTPSIATTPSDSAPAGGNVSDTATLTGGYHPTGTVTFQLYAPGDTTCTTPIATRTGTVSGSGTAASGNVAAGGVGTYRWVASYSGDDSNNPVTSSCGDEQVVVVKATPGIATTPSGSVPAGGVVSDTATISGGYHPTGNVTFQLYAPGDTTCTTPIATRTDTLSGSGTTASGNVTIGAAGTYRWTASYGGDANNNSVTSPCSAEQVTVTPQRLTGRAYGLTADASLAGLQLVHIAPTPDTGHISTTSTGSTSVPCTATLSGLISAHALCAKVATTEFPGKSVATASIDDTTIGITGIPVISVKTINSGSTTTCTGSTGTTTIAYLKVGNTVVIPEPTVIRPNTTVNVGVVKLVLNEQTPITTPDKGLTVNAVHVTVDALGLAKTDVVLASSESDIGNCP